MCHPPREYIKLMKLATAKRWPPVSRENGIPTVLKVRVKVIERNIIFYYITFTLRQEVQLPNIGKSQWTYWTLHVRSWQIPKTLDQVNAIFAEGWPHTPTSLTFPTFSHNPRISKLHAHISLSLPPLNKQTSPSLLEEDGAPHALKLVQLLSCLHSKQQ